ncbi:MAG: hypothetical protein U9O82_05875, partial [Thermodesulfobacteriota bacterium]|nr:hypothetical protein [Thermodesulfobacteriota bacterium]
AASDLPLAGILPASDELVTRELSGESYLEFADDVPFIRKAFKVFDKVFGFSRGQNDFRKRREKNSVPSVPL